MIKTVITFLLEKTELVLAGALVIAIVIAGSQCDRKQHFKQEVERQKFNIDALTDTVSTYENQAGELTYQIQALQTDLEQLETLNDSLYDEVVKERKNVEYLSRINAEISRDTVIIETEPISGVLDNWIINWDFSENGRGWTRILTGFTRFKIDSTGIPYGGTSTLLQDALNIQIVTGITEEDGRRRIFVRSTYPNIQFTQIEGAILDNPSLEPQKSSRFGLGLNIGASFTPDGLAVPSVGIGLNYHIFAF